MRGNQGGDRERDAVSKRHRVLKAFAVAYVLSHEVAHRRMQAEP